MIILSSKLEPYPRPRSISLQGAAAQRGGFIYIFSYYPYEEKSEEVTVEGKINHNWATSNVMEKNESTYMHLHKEV